jgi:general stress protein YciG
MPESDDTIQKSEASSAGEALKKPALRGFAAMSAEQRKALGRKGGKTAHERGTANKFTSETGRAAGRVPHLNGTAHQWTVEEAREAGRKGGRSARRRRAPVTKP